MSAKRLHIYITAIFAAILATIFFSVPSSSAFAADDPDLTELMTQAKAIKEEINAAHDEYLTAVQEAEEMAAQQRDAEKKLAETQEELAEAQKRLADIAVAEYKAAPNGDYLSLILDAKSFNEALSGLQYLQTMAEERQKVVEEIAGLEKELKEMPEKLAEQKALAAECANAADVAEGNFKTKLADVKKKMKPYLSEHAEKVASTSGSEQLEELVNYLENIEEGTEEQVAIVRAAHNLTGSGGFDNMCESWAETALRNAGIDMPRYIGAWQDCQENLYSTDMSEAKAGCLIWGSGSGPMGQLYGHVAIIVYANGNPEDIRVCDSVSASGTSQTLEEWVSWQTAVNADTGESGLFGWGYPPGYKW